MRIGAVLALLCLAAPLDARGQADTSRRSAGALLGAGWTYDDEGALGGGLAAGARLAVTLCGRTSGEVALDVVTHDRDVGYFTARGRTWLLQGSLVKRLGDGRVQPYILGGGLVAWHTATLAYAGGVPPATDTRAEQSANPGFTAGAGVAAVVGRRWEIGPEIRLLGMFVEDDSDPVTVVWVGLRTAYRF